MHNNGASATAETAAVSVAKFNFAYGSGGCTEEPMPHSVLRNVNFSVPKGARVLVVGLNGSGKSTLMRCLAGQHFHGHEQILMLGQPAFFSATLQKSITYLGSEWRNSALVRTDVPVEKVLRGATGFTEQKVAFFANLMNLEIAGASMARLSDGQRQGVQIAAALMKDFEVLLMDETTVECDVLVRKHLLSYLKSRSEATILYATHVFDGMSSWPTHIMHVGARGSVTLQVLEECADYQQLRGKWDPSRDSPLSALVESWLEKDHLERLEMRKEARLLPPVQTLEAKINASGKVGDKMYNYWN